MRVMGNSFTQIPLYNGDNGTIPSASRDLSRTQCTSMAQRSHAGGTARPTRTASGKVLLALAADTAGHTNSNPWPTEHYTRVSSDLWILNYQPRYIQVVRRRNGTGEHHGTYHNVPIKILKLKTDKIIIKMEIKVGNVTKL